MAIFGKLERYSNFGLLVMRIGLGAMMMVHGFPKITAGPSQWADLGHAMGNLHIHFWPTFWGLMCALTEAIGGLFCLLGLWFRPVCIFMIINFIVASMVHLTSINKVPEASHAIELVFIFFGLLFIGPGVYSVDRS